MYAYVRFLDKVLQIVNCLDIKKFNPNNIKYRKKYLIKWNDGEYYPGEILKVADTKEELEASLKTKRLTIPSTLPDTATEDSDDATNKVVEKSVQQKQKKSIFDAGHTLNSTILKSFKSKPSAVNVSNEHEIEKIKTPPQVEEKLEEILQLLTELKTIITDFIQEQAQNEKLTQLHANNFCEHQDNDDGVVPVPEVGELNQKTKEIHLGQSIYVDEKVYNLIYLNAKTGPQFVKRLAVAVFGYETLINSSVYGKKSSRCPKNEARPNLDATKMRALLDIYEHYLKKKGTDPYKLHSELQNMPMYIGQKIRDLRRPQKQQNINADRPATLEQQPTTQEQQQQQQLTMAEQQSSALEQPPNTLEQQPTTSTSSELGADTAKSQTSSSSSDDSDE